MKRVTIVFDDDELYKAVKVEAARTGRTVKDVVAEAVRAWLNGGRVVSEARMARRGAALEAAARLRAKQTPSETSIVDDIRAMRLERLKHLDSLS